MIWTVSSAVGSVISIFWKRRAGSAILFEGVAELLVGGRANHPDLAARRFDRVGGIHLPAGSRTGADDGVNFIDEQDAVLILFQL